MKVIYKGHKPKISISFPVGTQFRSQTIETITFIQEEPVEVKDVWAEALIKLDANFTSITDVKPKKTKIKSTEAITSDVEKRLEGSL